MHYEQCLRTLLAALDVQHVDEFMVQATPENCFKLGRAYVEGVERLVEASRRLGVAQGDPSSARSQDTH
jgi:hypothetical protein